MSYISDITLADSPALDAFGCLRVSNRYTLFDSKQLYDNSPLFWDDAVLSGAGTSSTHSTARASTVLGVSATTAGRHARQTKRRFNYQPGKSFLVELTGILGAGAAGITRRLGYFDDANGAFFELSGTTLYTVIRSSASGSPVDTKVAQSAWTGDKLDGTGISGITLHTELSQIFIMDLQWLGVGRVRFGFSIGGRVIYCNEINHANIDDVVYMSTPNLPLRYEIANDGTGGAATLEHICTTINSEGGQELTGVVMSINNGSTAVTASVVGTAYALLGIRLKTTHLSATIVNVDTSILGTTVNDPYLWGLWLNPTVASTFTYTDVANSAVQRATGATANTFTGGTLINSGYGSAVTAISTALVNSLNLGATIAGVRDELVLGVIPLGASLNVYGSMTWRELL